MPWSESTLGPLPPIPARLRIPLQSTRLFDISLRGVQAMNPTRRMATLNTLAALIFITVGPFAHQLGQAAGYATMRTDGVADKVSATTDLMPTQPLAGLATFRYESTGLSLLRPYVRGKVPVVLIHGLWSNPRSWRRMVEVLESDPALRERYQFWVFGYSTGQPILYSARLLRQAILDAPAHP